MQISNVLLMLHKQCSRSPSQSEKNLHH